MLLLASTFFSGPSIAELDELAQKRDVPGLTRFLASPEEPNPFKVIQTGGAFMAGRKGWRAKALTTPDGAKYVVFSTPLIAEDMGELLFRQDEAGKLSYVPEADDLGVALDRHSFDLRFDLAGARAILTDNLQAHWTDRPHPHFVFRLSPTFEVRSITDSAGQPVRFSQAGGIVAVVPGEGPLNLSIKYDGTVEMPGFERQISDREATLSASLWYPTIARGPTPYDITIRSRKDWTALAQGNLIDSKVQGEERITRFKNDLPVIWLAATAGPYKTEVTTIRGREYAVMSQSLTREEMQLQNVLNADVIDFYSKTFRPYPYKRWTALHSWQFQGGPGALEAYSFATYPGGLPHLDAHEPSHSWWGGLINNDYLRSLWNESFAEFCSDLYLRNQPRGNQAELRLAYVSVPSASPAFKMAPLSNAGDDIGPAAPALGYGKGAYVLQMLEDELGTDAMIKTMREWSRAHPPREIGRWEDYEAVVNRVTGGDYKWFFDQWVHRPGYAEMALSDVKWTGGKLSGKITFTGQPYRISTDLLIQQPDGSRSFQRILIPQQTDYRFELDCPARPALISLDPWQKLLRTRISDEVRTALGGLRRKLSLYLDPAHKDYLADRVSGDTLSELPSDLGGLAIIGHPDSTPAMRELCKQVGFEVSGQTLTYKGTKVDLNRGGALAVVDLVGGKQCMIGLGKVKRSAPPGEARLLVFDEYGRTLRAVTEPVITGNLSYRFETP